jgi:hypothetical protein
MIRLGARQQQQRSSPAPAPRAIPEAPRLTQPTPRPSPRADDFLTAQDKRRRVFADAVKQAGNKARGESFNQAAIDLVTGASLKGTEQQRALTLKLINAGNARRGEELLEKLPW